MDGPFEDGPAVSVAPHRWEYCALCRCFMVVCANCGNNCCNAISGENCVDRCADAYAKQEVADKAIAAIQRAAKERSE